jgi:catechol 2,3-dioxygenase-like lactoylglutathione lyase family enzyme
MRLQLALNVADLEQAIDYYSKLFDTVPHKQRPGYANFAIENPPLKLVLFENPNAPERLNHLGVEVFHAEAVDSVARRLSAAGILAKTERESTCCHATQDKVWSQEPQGLRWEWYRVTDDDPIEAYSIASTEDAEGPHPAGDVCCT